ncbi:hypothetical protein [Burkholderia pseudomallei]|uniref:Uncharacterized protein n=1 Tax=Burkholderia pseudomallei (strain 1106a) TaxID=357348 RepID=A3NV84_BURP0|nr:hypothetical protein [Burkholderia pseudomallei]ABN92132.1 hypothetical protein BURPS1106A_1990 [Burkholderia pseudomallei 1106a]ACQ95856.1 conserved hypothetical protein [Burkholderia pseudomallei MSHR346]EBA51117.1 hypothetical protein BURPS305_6573 [Burkholderia pseudomallei 305]EDO92159.1 hypothetical protein BURPSPAST_AA0632 [Burkholderia pseudomallei Pasteur 52237]EES26763.1 hypothetical protein BURPS1106B_A1227 [Burkholderia pseudomallei 1106b]
MQILIVLSCFLHSTPLTIAFGADFPQAVESGFESRFSRAKRADRIRSQSIKFGI